MSAVGPGVRSGIRRPAQCRRQAAPCPMRPPRPYLPACQNGLPRALVIVDPDLNLLNALAPNNTTTHAPVKLSCLSNNGWHASSSDVLGLRLRGGRHATVLSTTASERSYPALSIMVSSSCPDLPTNGFPDLSSAAPGPSPTNAIGKGLVRSNGTVLIRVSDSAQLVQLAISLRIWSARCLRRYLLF